MIFKPKVKQKVNQFFVKMPVFMLLALVCLIGHPARAEAKTTLDENMTHFVTIGEYDIIMTSGENLIGIRKSGVKVFQRRTRQPPGLAIFSVIRLRTPVTQSMFQILEKRHFIITRQMLMINQRIMLATAMTFAP